MKTFNQWLENVSRIEKLTGEQSEEWADFWKELEAWNKPAQRYERRRDSYADKFQKIMELRTSEKGVIENIIGEISPETGEVYSFGNKQLAGKGFVTSNIRKLCGNIYRDYINDIVLRLLSA